MVRLLAAGERHEVHSFLARSFDPAGGVDPTAVPIQQQARHQGRVVWRLAAEFGVSSENARQIKVVPHQVADEMSQVIVGNEVLDGRWKENRLIRLPTAKSLVAFAL